MNFFKHIIILVSLLVLTSVGYAQTSDVFTANAAELSKQVESFISAKTPENKAEVNKFKTTLQSGVISGTDLENVVALMNLYVKKRANALPHMLNLVKTIDAFWRKNRSNDFKGWYDYMLKVMNKNIPVSRMNETIVFTYNLLSYNSLEILGNKNWFLSANDYKMKFVTDKDGDDFIVVESSTTDIRCKVRDDSSLVIYGTTGSYNQKEHTWYGKKGKIDWRRGNLSPDSVYAELSDYTIDTKSDHYKAENILFHNKLYFQRAVQGIVEDKVVLTGKGEKARYPQFRSTVYDLALTDLIDGVDYVGGYSQKGVIFSGYSYSDSLELAKLTFKRNGKPFIVAKTQSVVFGHNKLEGKTSKIEIYVGDSLIMHPGLKLKYNAETEELILYKGSTDAEVAKYTDYYHNLFIDVNQVEWHRNDTLLYFATRPAAPYDYALFQSDEYFSLDSYSEMKGVTNIHPLVLIKKYYEEELKGNIENYSMKGLQKFIYSTYGSLLSDVQIHQMLLKLSYNDFINYDIGARRIYQINQKLFNWIGMGAGVKDYNSISIISSMPNRNGVNAILNLNDNILTIYNVLPFDLSQRRMVRVIPDSAITINKDLAIDFRGKIQAGLVDVYGKKFDFDYQKFSINIHNSDSMALFCVEKPKEGQRLRLDSVHSVLENVVGVINIDRPNNKSGFNRNVTTADNHFPLITTTDTSYVYYDRIASEKYVRDKFHVKIYPFTLDSLKYLKKNSFQKKADFVSGVFPLLHITFAVQPDYSLGFTMPTPKDGLQMYGGKGAFYNTVALNGKGLNGDGEIKYLTSVSRSKMFSFYLDSVSGGCYYLDIKGVKADQIGQIKDVKAEYPNVYSDTAYVYWMPHQDVFSTVTQDTTLKLYDKKIAFNGKLDLTPRKMIAQGEMLFNNDGLFSDKFLLKNSTFNADSAMLCNFDENSPGDSTGHFYTGRYDAEYDVTAKYAQFITTGTTSFVHFPQHKYKQFTDYFRYSLASHSFEFGKDLKDYDKKMIANTEDEFQKLMSSYKPNSKYKPLHSGVTMVSDKDTLTFPAQSVSYENSESVVNVNEPGIIEIVDSKIDPSGIIKIRKKGDIDRFDNVLITANLDTSFHKIINTSVKIRDKYYFKAKGGQYEYVNETKDISYLNLDSMEVRKIKLDTAASAPKVRISFGIGSVAPEEDFKLSPQYAFSGKYSFMGLLEGIKFNGFAYIHQNCDTMVRPFKFEGTLNPDHIIFPISERVMDTAKNRLYTGFYQDVTSRDIYPIFMGVKRNAADEPILEASRGLDYSIAGNLYAVAPSRRLQDASNVDNYVAYKQTDCSIYGEGVINTNVNIAPLQLVTKGTINYDREMQSTTLNTILTLNLVIKQDLVKMVADDIAKVEGLAPFNLTDSLIMRKLTMLCGKDTVAKVLKDYTMTGEISKMPSSLSKTFVFTDLTLKFDTIAKAYRSLGKIGISYVGEKTINRYVIGNIEIRPDKRKGDQITIYLEPERGTWYYFNYNAGMLYCLSSNNEFNDKIVNTKEKDRSFKAKDVDYQYLLANDEAKTKFLRSLKYESVSTEQNDVSEDTPAPNSFDENSDTENVSPEGGNAPESKQEQTEDEPDFIDE